MSYNISVAAKNMKSLYFTRQQGLYQLVEDLPECETSNPGSCHKYLSTVLRYPSERGDSFPPSFE